MSDTITLLIDPEGETIGRGIYCCGCQAEVLARLTSGKEIYPHRADLFRLPIWICDTCRNVVGCHHKTAEPTKPLGVIPTREIKRARQHIHALLDPLWMKQPKIMRKKARAKLYAALSRELGYQYHTGEIRSVEEARRVYVIVQRIAKERKND